jgi:hypothetical protein
LNLGVIGSCQIAALFARSDQALSHPGATQTMAVYLHFIDHVVARSGVGDLQLLNGFSGNPETPEVVSTAFDGYQRMGPVRIGSQAASQTQHDVRGSVILATSHLFFDERFVRAGDPALLAHLNKLGARAAGALWGNFPQTYSMVGIMNGALRLSRPWGAIA